MYMSVVLLVFFLWVGVVSGNGCVFVSSCSCDPCLIA